jgi:hypothetical protein
VPSVPTRPRSRRDYLRKQGPRCPCPPSSVESEAVGPAHPLGLTVLSKQFRGRGHLASCPRGKLAPRCRRLGGFGVGLALGLASISFSSVLSYLSRLSFASLITWQFLAFMQQGSFPGPSAKRAWESTSAPPEPTTKRHHGAPGEETQLLATDNSFRPCLLSTSLAGITLPELTLPSLS